MRPTLLFDTETDGRCDFRAEPGAPHQPNLVQLAAIVASPARVIAEINVIVRPDGWVITPELTAIHGISQELAMESGVPRRAALAMFNQLCLLAGRLCAYNMDFDYRVMLTQYYRGNQGHRMSGLERVCAMQAATPICKLPGRRPGEYKWPKLIEAHQALLGTGFDGAHNAMADVEALARVYWELDRRGAIAPMAESTAV